MPLFGAIAVVVIVCAILLSATDREVFSPYFGTVPPLLVMVAAVAVATAALHHLRARGRFEILRASSVWRGVGAAAGLATLFAIIVIAVDALARFPRNLNVPLPGSLLFYPAIGFVVEAACHLLPLALLLASTGLLQRRHAGAGRMWPYFIPVALFEPAVQVVLASAHGPVSWLDAYVGVHVFAFNLVQLHLLRRYDFVSMYAMRLTYYFYWHILWGHLRLQWLF